MRAIRLNADSQVATDKMVIYGLAICGGGDAATITLYNEADNSKTATAKVAKLGVAAGVSDNIMFAPEGLYLDAGVYADVTGTTPEVFVYVR